MKIAICDSSQKEIDYFRLRIEPFLHKNGDNTFKIYEYLSGKPLVDDFKDGRWFDMIVMETVLESENGVDIAKQLRKAGYSRDIAFWTSHKEFIYDAADVGFSHYIIKGSEQGRMYSTLGKTIGKIQSKMFTIRHKDCVIRIPFDKIEYFEANNKITIVHCTNSICHSTTELLKSIQKHLDSRFLRCYRSYIINMDYVEKVDTDFTMFSGDKILIRMRGISKIKEAYMKYIGI